MRLFTSFLTLLASLTAVPAFAQNALETIGKPVDGALNFQPAATELARDIHFLDGMINYIIFAITALVLLLIAIIVVRFNRRANPNPASFTHNTPIEVLWTVGPILVLVIIGAFSLPILFKQQEIPEGDVHIKVTGHQWYWSYQYTDTENDFEFDSYMVGNPASLDEDARPADADVTPYILNDAMRAKLVDAGFHEDEFLLATDTSVVVPVNKVVVMKVTADDVIHSWTIPAFGVKQDAVPGRLAQLWFKAEKEGIYFGQCSELCGKDHAFMPISVKVVSQEAYDKWLAHVTETEEYIDVLALN